MGAAMFAAKYRLGQPAAYVRRNNIRIDGSTEAVMPLGDLASKCEASTGTSSRSTGTTLMPSSGQRYALAGRSPCQDNRFSLIHSEMSCAISSLFVSSIMAWPLP